MTLRAILLAIACISSGLVVLNSPCDIMSIAFLDSPKSQVNIDLKKNSTYNSKEIPTQRTKKSKTNVLVLSSHGGYGHTAASITLQQVLSDKYAITIVHPIHELMICGVPDAESFYNKLLKFGWYQSMNFISRYVAPFLFRQRYEKIEKIITQHIEKTNADIVISLIPFINFPATEAARKKDVPYLLVTTDNDLNNWVQDVEKIKHPFFEVTTGTELSLTKNLLLSKNVSSEKIHSIGLPIRADFLEKKNRKKIRKEFALCDKPTVLIMMGGNGSNLAYQYAKILAEQDLSIQLIVISGRNQDLLRKIKELVPHPSNSVCPVGFTEKVSDLMAVSDLLISKPGPGTIAEALQMKLPILVDTSSSSLYWEKINLDIISNYAFGDIIKSKDEFCDQVKKYLYDNKFRNEITKAFNRIPLNKFDENIESIISGFLKDFASYKAKLRNSSINAKEDLPVQH